MCCPGRVHSTEIILFTNIKNHLSPFGIQVGLFLLAVGHRHRSTTCGGLSEVRMAQWSKCIGAPSRNEFWKPQEVFSIEIDLIRQAFGLTPSPTRRRRIKNVMMLFYEFFDELINFIFILLLAVNMSLCMVCILYKKYVLINTAAIIKELLCHI